MEYDYLLYSSLSSSCGAPSRPISPAFAKRDKQKVTHQQRLFPHRLPTINSLSKIATRERCRDNFLTDFGQVLHLQPRFVNVTIDQPYWTSSLSYGFASDVPSMLHLSQKVADRVLITDHPTGLGRKDRGFGPRLGILRSACQRLVEKLVNIDPLEIRSDQP